ncbi:MAG TPA: ATP-grasp domain-containing protein [Pirellulales bacterium]|nr:ATP-grasp domain-containing protein [Pirellulales bacterium]
MQLFLYEHLTGGGMPWAGDAAWQSLAAEGQTMIAALAADFARLGGVAVTILRDRRLKSWCLPGCRVVEVNSAEEHRREFDRFAAAADWTVVIAPEIDGILLDRCRRVSEVGGRLLGPPLDLIALASDKQRTAERLQAAGVSVPRGRPFASGDAWPRDFTYPAVWKPRDGAGSVDIVVVDDWHSPARPPAGRAGRLEEFRPGLPASVALVCGPAGCTALPACRQQISDDGRLRYLGGSVPLPPPYAKRAARLAERAVATLDKPLGYLGVDLVLGHDADGSDDVVIEINPRLTTSYLGLRALCRQNLAGAMLEAALGRPLALSFASEEICFGIGK